MVKEWEVLEDGRPFVWKTHYDGKYRSFGTIIQCVECGDDAFARADRTVVHCGKSCSMVGSGSPHWKGGRKNHRGRILLKDRNNPMADSNGYVYEHRVLAAKAMGRPLGSDEHVHHIDMDTTNNNNFNLLVCDSSYHRWLHVQYERAYAKTIKEGRDALALVQMSK
jgi:hypothetical protein